MVAVKASVVPKQQQQQQWCSWPHPVLLCWSCTLQQCSAHTALLLQSLPRGAVTCQPTAGTRRDWECFVELYLGAASHSLPALELPFGVTVWQHQAMTQSRSNVTQNLLA